jgi:hypothetical protein
MVDQKELHLTLPRFVHLLVVDVDFHPFLDRGRTAGLQLRHAIDLHEAHAALADDREAGVVAEMRDVNVGRFGSLDDVHPFRNIDFGTVKGDFGHSVG